MKIIRCSLRIFIKNLKLIYIFIDLLSINRKNFDFITLKIIFCIYFLCDQFIFWPVKRQIC